MVVGSLLRVFFSEVDATSLAPAFEFLIGLVDVDAFGGTSGPAGAFFNCHLLNSTDMNFLRRSRY